MKSRSRRYQPKPRGVKRTDLKRQCPSGKAGFKKSGDARAAASAPTRMQVYRCEHCKEFHLADRVGRKERRRRASKGVPDLFPREGQ